MKKKTFIIFMTFLAIVLIADLSYIGLRQGSKKEVQMAEMTSGLPNINQFQIVASGTMVYNKTANSTGGYVDYTHNLGYTPIVFASLIAYNGNTIILPYTQAVTFGAKSGLVDSTFFVDVNSTRLRVWLSFPDAAPTYLQAITFTVKYYLMRETASIQ